MITPTKEELRVAELCGVIDALLEYIDAIPEDVVEKLPTMPGICRDYVEAVLEDCSDEYIDRQVKK